MCLRQWCPRRSSLARLRPAQSSTPVLRPPLLQIKEGSSELRSKRGYFSLYQCTGPSYDDEEDACLPGLARVQALLPISASAYSEYFVSLPAKRTPVTLQLLQYTYVLEPMPCVGERA